MIDNNLVSSKAVIAKIIADNDMREDDIRISDIKEWCGEALEKIGAVQLLERKQLIIPVKDYLAKLPCDLYRINLVGFSTTECSGWLPMRKATGSFSCMAHLNECECGCNDLCMLVQDDALIPLVKNMFNLVSDREALDILNCDPNMKNTLSALLNLYTVPTVNGRYVGTTEGLPINKLEYSTKPGYIITNTRNGYVNVSYYAIISDEDGMPMIPDLPSYFEAIYWYVTMKLEFPRYKNGKTPRYVYYDIKNSWNFYRKQAYADAMMPTIDELETIKNVWNTFVPEVNEHDTFFSTTGDPQILYNLNRL